MNRIALGSLVALVACSGGPVGGSSSGGAAGGSTAGTVGSSSGSGSGSSSSSGGSSSSSGGRSSSSGGSSGSCSAAMTLGSGTVMGYDGYSSVQAAVLIRPTFYDGGADPTRLRIELAAEYWAPGCVPAHPTYNRFELQIAATGAVATGTYVSDDGGATVRWELGGDTGGGSLQAERASITLDALSPNAATGAFACDIAHDGTSTVHVTGTFDAVPAPAGSFY